MKLFRYQVLQFEDSEVFKHDINKLGSEGWEVVSVFFSAMGSPYTEKNNTTDPKQYLFAVLKQEYES